MTFYWLSLMLRLVYDKLDDEYDILFSVINSFSCEFYVNINRSIFLLLRVIKLVFSIFPRISLLYR